jgi:CRISPR-associated protein Cmr3
MRLHSQNPNGLLWAKDEGEGFAASQNQYRSGKGDDVQQGLEDFNGGSYGKDLATDNSSYFIPNRKIQKVGGMHVTQLMKQLEADDFADYRGDLARWLFCAVPFGERKLELQRSQRRSISAVLTQALKSLYEGLETLEPHDDGFGYLFDDDAYALYAAYQHQLRDWCKAEVGSLSAAFPKMEQYCIRFAGWLHIINAKLGNVKPAPTIDSRTMAAAIELTDFYIGQLRLIYASAVPGQALTGLMFEVQQFCQSKAVPLTAGKIRAGSRTLKAKIDAATMKQILAQLVQSGYGQMDGDRYEAFPDPVEPEFSFECEFIPE